MGEVNVKVGVQREVALLLCVAGLGVTVLCGPAKEGHMKANVEGWEKWRSWVGKEGNREIWKEWMVGFEVELQRGVDAWKAEESPKIA